MSTLVVLFTGVSSMFILFLVMEMFSSRSKASILEASSALGRRFDHNQNKKGYKFIVMITSLDQVVSRVYTTNGKMKVDFNSR